jgi:hypothetical protein
MYHEYQFSEPSRGSGQGRKRPDARPIDRVPIDRDKIVREKHERFRQFLKNAELRLLTYYIEQGKLDLPSIDGISKEWLTYFKQPSFVGQSVIWMNPTNFLLTPKRAAKVAAQELLSRIANRFPSHLDAAA